MNTKGSVDAYFTVAPPSDCSVVSFGVNDGKRPPFLFLFSTIVLLVKQGKEN